MVILDAVILQDAFLIEPTVLQAFILVLAGVIGWLAKKVWEMDEDLKSLEQTIRGTPHRNEDGYIGQSYAEFSRIHERLDELNEKMQVVSEILKRNELNGDYDKLEEDE